MQHLSARRISTQGTPLLSLYRTFTKACRLRRNTIRGGYALDKINWKRISRTNAVRTRSVLQTRGTSGLSDPRHK